MSRYLLEDEERWWRTNCPSDPAATIHWSFLRRAEARAADPGLLDGEATVDWWHLIVDYLAEAAMAYRLKPTDRVGRWVVSVTNEIVARDENDWIGPWFRDRRFSPARGYLETAHVCVAVAAAIDLVADAFSDQELAAAYDALGSRGVDLCAAWLDTDSFHNQRCVLTAGLAAAAVGSGHTAGIDRAMDEFVRCGELFQPDGSYGESTQYASYAGWALAMAYETLVRDDPARIDRLPIAPYARCVRWWAAGLLSVRSLSGWGPAPRPRMANFNDAGAIAAPHGDLLLHVAARCARSMPDEAALARWLFDEVYLSTLDEGPFDRSSFGMVPRVGFLAPPLWSAAQAVQPRGPLELGLSELQAFSNGDVVARDSWDGRTVLAVRGGGEPYHVLYHQHRDLNSFIVAHSGERLLVDPGHSCYRGLAILHDRSTMCHNTCTFEDPSGSGSPHLQNQFVGRGRALSGRKPEPPVRRGGRRLVAERLDDVTVIGSECADVYGEPLIRFARFWVLLGSHSLFVIDHVVAERPVRVSWHWVLNNRDSGLRFKAVPPDRIVARRGAAGMKLFHAGGDLDDESLRFTKHAYVHDAYHPKPNQLGEGAQDSGRLATFRQREPLAESLTVHAIALDTYGVVAGWHLLAEDGWIGLQGPPAAAGRDEQRIRLETEGPVFPGIVIENVTRGGRYRLSDDRESYRLARLE